MIRRLAREATVAAVALGVGLGGALLVLDRDGDPAPVAGPDLSDVEGAAVVEPAAPADVPPGRPAADPAAALDGFLTAEAAGDFETSFLLLSSADRGVARSAARWRASHDDLPNVVGHEAAEPVIDGDRASIAAAMRYEPTLDPFVGLIPARADASWSLVREDGGWAVAFQRTAVTPQHVDDARVDADVERWVERRQSCGDPGASEYAGGLLAGTVLAGELCDNAGDVRIGETTRVAAGASVGPFLSEFGDEVLEWGRIVELRSPSPMRIVVAPLGERWLVIGVLPPTNTTPR